MQEAIVIEDVGRVRLLRINRPAALNAMNQAVFGGIRDALKEAEGDDNIAVCVITGEGRAFCAGQDMDEMQDMGEAGSLESQFPSMLKVLTHFSKPLLAAVNGLGVGIGMTMLSHCDLVLMAGSARLRTPFPQLGLAPEAGSSYTFQGRMGWQNAAYALMSGRWFSANECHDMGLVWRVVEDENLLDETLEVAQELASNPIPSLVATKQLMLAAGRPEHAWAAHNREMAAYESLMGGPANREAVAAFMEKRAPDFSAIPGL
ncbi:MAG: enoyl-CoA hydratase-related protein [Pseudomonadota bacterium]